MVSYKVQETEVCNFADDTTPYTCDEKLEQVLLRFEHDSALASYLKGSNFREKMI